MPVLTVVGIVVGLVALRPTTVVSWHLTEPAVWFDRAVRGRTLTAGCEIVRGLTRDRGLFLVPMSGRLNGHIFYLGYLSDTLDVMDERGGWHPVDSPGLIFTRWGTRDRADLRPAAGGHWVASDHEGDHVSVRRPAVLPPGKYTFRLRLAEVDATGCWVAASVHDPAAGVTHKVGRLRFPGAELDAENVLIAFLEVPGWRHPADNDSNVPVVRTAVGGWAVDGVPLRVTAAEARYRSYVPQKARATWADDRLWIEAGPRTLTRRIVQRPLVVAARQAGVLPIGDLGGPFLLYRERIDTQPALP